MPLEKLKRFMGGEIKESSRIMSPAEELEYLRRQYEVKKRELGEALESGPAVLKEHVQKQPEKILHQKYQISKIEEESLITKILNLPSETHDKQIGELLALAEERGVLNAVSVARKLGNPHLEDDFHRALVQVYLRDDLSKFKFEKPLSSSLSMALYEITLPREDARETSKTFKELVSAMEQFYSGMAVIGEDKESPYFSLEIGISTIGEEIVFYIAVPRKRKAVFEKQIEALFPSIKIEEKKGDYNIFKPEGVGAGAVAKLKAYSVLPIKTYDKFDVDPMLVIINSFSKLQKIGEGAALQIIVSPTKEDFSRRIKFVADDMRKGISLPKAVSHTKNLTDTFLSALGEFFSSSDIDKKYEEIEKRAGADDKIIKLLEEKASKQSMPVNIRILVSAENQNKAQEILRELESSFLQFTDPYGNGLTFENVKGKALDDLFYNFSFRLFDKKNSIYLNTSEMTTVFHFPIGISSIAQLKYLKSKDAPPPLSLPESGLFIGRNNYRGKESDIFMKEDDRRRHVYVIGQTGTGKSVMIKNMIVQDIEAGKGVCFIDPHGQDLDDILTRIPENRLNDVIYFNPGDTERPLGLNMLEYDEKYPEQKTLIVNELLGIFNKLFDMKTAGGPAFEQYFRNAALLVMDDPESGNTLIEVARIFTDKNFRDYKISKCRNPVINTFWKELAEKSTGEQSLQNFGPYITNKFDNFISNDIMRPIIAQKKSSFNFREIMDNGKILLINLSKGRLGDINANLIGLIIVGKLLMASLSRTDMPESERKDFYLYLDEFQNITTSSIATILSEARKYRLNLTIAHQFVGQLEEEIKKAVFGNVGSMFVFRVGAEDAEFLEKQFEPVFNANDLMNIGNYNAYIRLLVDGYASRPFNIQTPPFVPGNIISKEVIALSSQKYGRPRQEIEEEINKRYNF